MCIRDSSLCKFHENKDETHLSMYALDWGNDPNIHHSQYTVLEKIEFQGGHVSLLDYGTRNNAASSP